MIRFQGSAISPGKATAKLYYYQKKERKPCGMQEINSEKELLRLEGALSDTIHQIHSQMNELGKSTKADQTFHDLLQSYLSFLQDDYLFKDIRNRITEELCSADLAITETGQAFAAWFDGLPDPAMRDRVIDLKDVLERLKENLRQDQEDGQAPKTEGSWRNPLPVSDFLLLARELAPVELMQISDAAQNHLKGLILTEGAVHSHTAILARSMNLPAVFGISLEESGEMQEVQERLQSGRIWQNLDGQAAYLDGERGQVLLALSDKEEKVLRNHALHSKRERRSEPLHLPFPPGLEGKGCSFYCNISSSNELDAVLSSGAEGIGLCRTEFLYLGRSAPPSEAELTAEYRRILSAMKEKPVILRTFDFGGDKIPEFLSASMWDERKNLRGIQLALAYPELFLTQLRAILRASPFGNARILLPMISDLSEVQEAKRYLQEAMEELDTEGVAYDSNIPIGIMMETSLAVKNAEELARWVDFFSIGTNDLTYSLFGGDRFANNQNPPEKEQYLPMVLLAIQTICQTAKKIGIPVGICGDLAANPELYSFFCESGVDVLSMPAGLIPAFQ